MILDCYTAAKSRCSSPLPRAHRVPLALDLPPLHPWLSRHFMTYGVPPIIPLKPSQKIKFSGYTSSPSQFFLPIHCTNHPELKVSKNNLTLFWGYYFRIKNTLELPKPKPIIATMFEVHSINLPFPFHQKLFK